MFFKGDFFDIINDYGDDHFDVCVTDPPYNVDAKAYSQSRTKRGNKVSYDDNMEIDAYYDFSAEWFEQAMRTSKMVVFSPGHANIGMWYCIKQPSDFLFHHKPDGQGWSSNCMTNKTELYLMYKGLKRKLPTNAIVAGYEDDFTESLTVKANIEHHIRYGNHPHPKPRSLYEKILSYLKPERVLDPFAGSGNCLFACEKLGIEYLGCEINPEYWDLIQATIAEGRQYRIDSLWEV